MDGDESGQDGAPLSAFERDAEREEWLRSAARGSIDLAECDDDLVHDVIMCDLIGCLLEPGGLRQQPEDWCLWSARYKGFKAEEAPKVPTGSD